jgi:hypothetical protein
MPEVEKQEEIVNQNNESDQNVTETSAFIDVIKTILFIFVIIV